MSWKGPLSGSYASAVGLVILALTPYLVLTSAVASLNEMIGRDLHLSEAALQMTSGMANAAYCFGTVLAIQLTTRLPGRRLLVGFIALFVLASAIAAWAPSPSLFIAARVVQGLTTALMLISAVPPLVIGWPAARMRPTATTMNLALFGAVALGPVVGGVAAGLETWRTVFWVMAALGLAAMALIVLTFEDQEPQDPDAPIDVVSVGLAGLGTAALFFGAAELTSHGFTELVCLGPLLLGAVLVVSLVAHQYAVEDPLMPVEKLASTISVAAIVIAMSAAAASVGLVDLASSALELRKTDPTHGAMLFWPEFGGALAVAILFGRLVATRFLSVLAFSGLGFIAAAGVVLSGVATGSEGLVLIGVGLSGVGVAASVAPSLFTAGFTLPAPLLPRVISLIELLRGVAGFLAAPLLLHLSETVGATPAKGIESAVWVAFAIALGGFLLAGTVWIAGGGRTQTPKIEEWLDGERSAIDSPALGAVSKPAAELES